LYLSMDANFRAQQKDKTNDPADFHLHPGAAYFREDSAFREYLAAVGDEHEASTCSGFKALNVLRAGRYKNTLVSGILSVVCARHSFFRPNGTVDLQKGERYTHADYALAGALAGTEDVPRIVLTYDVNCQYCRRLPQRFPERFPHILPSHLDRIEFYIPKMHLLAHREDCQYLYSLNFNPSTGRVDGEGIERTWSDMNESATSTREMNAGHRHEVLEDHMDEVGFKKLIKLRK
ncbi:hypothetical protein BOTBODRAFT_77692, partial [Botryobasidium botryosum FD-172 SS1]